MTALPWTLPIHVRCELTIEDADVFLAFSKSDDQASRGHWINAVLSADTQLRSLRDLPVLGQRVCCVTRHNERQHQARST